VRRPRSFGRPRMVEFSFAKAQRWCGLQGFRRPDEASAPGGPPRGSCSGDRPGGPDGRSEAPDLDDGWIWCPFLVEQAGNHRYRDGRAPKTCADRCVAMTWRRMSRSIPLILPWEATSSPPKNRCLGGDDGGKKTRQMPPATWGGKIGRSVSQRKRLSGGGDGHEQGKSKVSCRQGRDGQTRSSLGSLLAFRQPHRTMAINAVRGTKKRFIFFPPPPFSE